MPSEKCFHNFLHLKLETVTHFPQKQDSLLTLPSWSNCGKEECGNLWEIAFEFWGASTSHLNELNYFVNEKKD